MTTLILTIAVFAVAMLALSVGIFVAGKSIKGHCGGPSCTCATEGGDITQCSEHNDDPMSLPVHPG
ncbi:MAG: hypothetical protein V2I67_09850 [Thermoanaerobaculales bacterium]|jgi:hypothetical protein|nr:hypothetical protein [Thermoanaerobaculales bacterium]